MIERNPLYLLVALVLALGATTLVSCNSDDDDDDTTYTYSESQMTTLVTGFALKEDDDVIDNLDSVFFTIDYDNGVIYNADSLPVGTDVTKLVTDIDFLNTVSSAVLTITGGKLQQDTTIAYEDSSTDSIDFTGNVTLTVTSYDKSSEKVYDIKVNVHQVEPDSMVWNLHQQLPGSNDTSTGSKTVLQGDTYRCLVNNGGTYILSSAYMPYQATWAQDTLSLSFVPNIETFTANDNFLYILDTEGELYSSQDGLVWEDCNKQWVDILGGYESRVLGVWSDGSAYYHDEYPLSDAFEMTLIEDGFPIHDMSPLVRADNKWVVNSQAMLVGGNDANGNAVANVWGYDGERWGRINDIHSDALPALSGATLFPYYAYSQLSGTLRFTKQPTWFIVGGVENDGTMNDEVFVSHNQGINWEVADSALMMNANMPLFTGAQAFVVNETLSVSDASNAPRRVSQYITSWDCPYIYLFGGYGSDDKMLPYVWRGVYMRMTFYPLY